MKVVILCGGLGTRLREETEFRPKPMVEIGGRPILWHIMKLYASYGLQRFVLCAGYRGDMIKDYFLHYGARNHDFTVSLNAGEGVKGVEVHGDHAEQDWMVTVLDTGATTNTGGRVRHAAAHLDEEHFMVTYGDGLGDVDLKALMDFHLSHGRIGTVTVVRPPLRFGVLDLNEDDSVARFREKPQSEDWVSAGFFVFRREFLDYLDLDSVLEDTPLEKLAEAGELKAFRHEGFWQPMDTYREREILVNLWENGEAPWRTWTD